jgi:hypothetical protein
MANFRLSHHRQFTSALKGQTDILWQDVCYAGQDRRTELITRALRVLQRLVASLSEPDLPENACESEIALCGRNNAVLNM